MAETVGQLNPFRYRGYYYDTETGFYYLQSRYYDPSVGRFLNADGFVSTGQGILGNNMFAYCNNNPVIYKDDTGEFLKLAIVVVAIVVVCLVSFTSSEKQSTKPSSQPTDHPNSTPSAATAPENVGGTSNDSNTDLDTDPSELSGALYDNDRFEDNHAWHEEIAAYAIQLPAFNVDENNISLIGGEFDILTGGWETDYFDLSLLDFGHADAGVYLKGEEFQLGAIVSA